MCKAAVLDLAAPCSCRVIRNQGSADKGLVASELPHRPDRRAPSLHPHYRISSLPRTRPPLRLASVLCSSWDCHLEVSLNIEVTGSHVPHKSLRWTHAILVPAVARAVNRHPPSFVPDQQLESGFDDVPTLSTHKRWFTCVHLSSAHLTGTSRLFRNAHHPGHWAKAASGGLDPDPATRVRGAAPHLLCSKAAPAYSGHEYSFAPSWRTIVGVAHVENPPTSIAVSPLLSP